MIKIQTLNKISPKGLDLFDRENYEVASDLPSADGIVLRSFKMHDMELDENLKAIARAGAGVNNIPVDKCLEKGIVVFNTPGANANAVKEIVIASLFLSSRDIIGGVVWSNTLKGKAEEVSPLVEKNKSNFAGNEISGKKLGVIGLGAIGAMVANSAIDLGMDVIGYDPYISVEAAWKLSGKVENATGLETLLKQVDYISIHVPLLESTKDLLNKEKFAMMKDGVKIVNFSRDGLVNSDDVISAIKENKVSCYITDFPEDKLLGVDGIISIPHLGASTIESEENCAIMAAKQIKEFLEDGNIINSVNFPNATLPRQAGQSRVIIANKNIPNMIGEITSLLADSSINIIDMLNKSRGDIAYNIIDTQEKITDDIVVKLKSIDGVIMARAL